MKLVVKDIIKETEDAITLCFKNGGLFNKLSYKAGQFMTLHVPIEGSIQKRAYSFSSNPFTDKDLKVTIKRVQNGLVSNYIHDALKVGDKLEIDKPTGSFYIEPDKNSTDQYVFFAGGSGITPIFSIIKSLLAKQAKYKIVLVYANRNFESIIFQEALDELEKNHSNNFVVEYILSENKQLGSNYHAGLVTNELILDLFQKHGLEFKANKYMVCGPFGYMESMKGILASNGVAFTNIKVEVFKSPSPKLVGKDLMSDVEIQFNGASHKIKVAGNKSILLAAMANNIALPYSCRSGMCASCKASCVSGAINMTEGHYLEQAEVDEGKILTCISYPASENVVIAF